MAPSKQGREAMRLLHNAGFGKWGMFIGVVGVELLFATGVYYMVSVLSEIVFPDFVSTVVGWVVGLFIFLLGVNLFLNGEYTLRDIEEYELVNGKYAHKNENGDVTGYYNRPSRKWSVYVQYVLVIAADLTGLAYRIMESHASYGQAVLLFCFFGILAGLPIVIGHALYAQMNKPVAAIQRDYMYQQQVTAIHNSNKRENTPKHEKAGTNPTERRANTPPPQLNQGKSNLQALPSPRPSTSAAVNVPLVPPSQKEA